METPQHYFMDGSWGFRVEDPSKVHASILINFSDCCSLTVLKSRSLFQIIKMFKVKLHTLNEDLKRKQLEHGTASERGPCAVCKNTSPNACSGCHHVTYCSEVRLPFMYIAGSAADFTYFIIGRRAKTHTGASTNQSVERLSF